MQSVHLQLSADLLARVDEAAGDVPRNRWIRRAVEQALGDAESRAPIVVNHDQNQPVGWVALHADMDHPEGLVLSPGWLNDTGEILCWSAERTPARPRENIRSSGQVRGRATVAGFLGGLDTEDFGDDPTRHALPPRSTAQVKRDVQPRPKGGKR